jgi:formamidopyrimidine-DNA glycosylase
MEEGKRQIAECRSENAEVKRDCGPRILRTENRVPPSPFPILYSQWVPELPEVETIVRGLANRVTGETIDSVWIGSRKQPLKSSAAKIAATLENSRIRRVHRAGKHIVLDLEQANGSCAQPQRAQWIVHLGMTGSIVVTSPTADVAKHTHLIAKLASGHELRFVDPRMFGKLSVSKNGFDPGGVEPLDATLEQFTAMFRGRKSPIKSALLNQKLLRGVGNIYADESLFRAGIRPRRRVATLTRDDLRRLFHSVQEVLREAIALGGSSISDYVDAEGEEGFFQLQHRVYGREGEPCSVCRSPVKRVVLGGRSSHYCPKCQK